MTPVLELESLEKTYRPGLFRKQVAALRGLDLTVRRGETYGFVGPNGAGKTTTFKIVLGLLQPTGGRGCLLGHPLGSRQGRRRLGFLPELPAYYRHLTVAELLRFARSLSGVAIDSAADRRLLERLNLATVTDRPVGRLSKGQLQRVGLAQALVHEPEFLILDEPMSGLDPVGRALVKDLLRSERRRGRTILLSSHVLSDVESLADTVGLLSDGRLIREGSPEELLEDSVRSVRIEGTGPLPEDLLAGMPEGSGLSGATDGWTLELVSPGELQIDACLRRILKHGGRIRNVQVLREDLEAVFVRLVGSDQRVSA